MNAKLQHTCQSASVPSEHPRPMCREPSVWEYIGVPPLEPKKAQYQWQTIQTRLYLCLEHGRELWVAIGGYQTNYNEAERIQLRRLDQEVVHFVCMRCGQHVKYEYVSEPGSHSFVKGPPEYCPWCGTKGSPAMPDPERDYWDIIAQGFDGMSVTLLKALFDEWVNAGSKFIRFRDYVEHRLAEVEI